MVNSPIEPHVLSLWAQAKGLTCCFIYRGPSMFPTFQNGDFLYLHSPLQKLYSGDVIVFTVLDKADYVVHRVVSVSDQGVITRGDHNRQPDAFLVPLKQIIGRVEFVENKHGIRRVANGILGLELARIWWLILGLDRLSRRLFWMPYNFIRARRIASVFWRPKILKVWVQSERGQQIKYLYKNRTVAVWNPSCRRFDCRKPFDLVIPSPLNEERPSS